MSLFPRSRGQYLVDLVLHGGQDETEVGKGAEGADTTAPDTITKEDATTTLVVYDGVPEDMVMDDDKTEDITSLYNTNVREDEDSTEGEPYEDSGSEYTPSLHEQGLYEEDEREESDPPTDIDGRKGKRKSKGQGEAQQWKRKVNAKLRLEGKSYLGFKKNSSGKYVQSANRGERALQIRCNGHATLRRNLKSFHCSEITDDQRQNIFHKFWKLGSWEAKRVFVQQHVLQQEPNQRRITTEESRKNITFQYFLTIDVNLRRQVCKKMFLGTLGIGEKTVRAWVSSEENEVDEPEELEAVQNRSESKCNESVRKFLETLPKMESHYCRSSTRKMYLEPVWDSYRHLYREYSENYCSKENKKAASWRTFMKVFRKMNVELFHPKKDQCNECTLFKNGNLNAEDFAKHQKKKNEARDEKEKDKTMANDNNTDKLVWAYTVDLQAVLLAPRLNASANYYKTKLKVHNLTYYNLGNKDVTCYVWHEANGGLESDIFASIVRKFIKSELDKAAQRPHVIIIWSDGCCYQNRNVKMSNTLLELAIEENIVIEQKYLEVGHTQMEVDSVHSTIERKLKNRREVYVPADYLQIIKTARIVSPYKAIALTFKDFYKCNTSLYSSIRPGIRKGDPCVNDLVALKYTAEGIEFKLHFSEAWEFLPSRPKRSKQPTEYTPLYSDTCPIDASKYGHLQELKTLIPSDYRAFYEQLKHK